MDHHVCRPPPLDISVLIIGTRYKILLGASTGVHTIMPEPTGFRTPLPELPYPEYEKEEYGFQPATSTLTDELFRWTAAYRRAPAVSLFFTIVFGCFGYWAGAWPMRLARFLKPRITQSIVRWFVLVVGSAAALFLPIVISTALLIIHIIYGGTALTILPCFAGFAGGGLLACAVSFLAYSHRGRQLA
jgi:hypothetical protein